MKSFFKILFSLAAALLLLSASARAATNVVAAVQPGSLAYHLATNAAARAARFNDPHEAMVEIHALLPLHVDRYLKPEWSQDFWLAGVKGLPATCIGYSNYNDGQGLCTMVSPRHYLCATHMHPEGKLIAFLDAGNRLHWRQTLQRVDVASDTSVGLLNEDLPPSVGFLPVLPENFAAYLPVASGFPPASTNFYFQGIGMNQDMRLFGEPMVVWHPDYVTWNAEAGVTNGLGPSWNLHIRGGDSSNPAMILVGDQLVLVSHNFYAAGGPNYARQIPQINAAMHLLSVTNRLNSDYQLTQFSLTNWPAFP
jgi:hypothetical protein